MRRLGIGALLVGVVGIASSITSIPLGLPPASNRAQPGDVLLIEPSELTIPHGATDAERIITFTIRNRGPQPVALRDVSTNCGCTVIELPTVQVVPTAGSVSFTARVSPPTLGNRRVTVTVRPQSPDVSAVTARILISGKPLNVPYLLHVNHEIRIDSVAREPATKAFALEAVEFANNPAWIRGLQASVPWVAVSAPETSEQPAPNPGQYVQRTYRFDITADFAKNADDARVAVLEVITESPATAPRTDIRIRARLVPAVAAVPDSLYFSANRNAFSPVNRKVMFLPARPESRLACELASAPPYFNVVRSAQETVRSELVSFDVQLKSLPDDAPDAIVKAQLNFRTNDPDCSEVVVPVFVQLLP